MKRKSKKTGCLVAFIALWILGLIGLLVFNRLATTEEVIETVQIPQEMQTIKVENKDIRYKVLTIDTLNKISQIMRVDENTILKAYGLTNSESYRFKPETGQQIDILADVDIVEKNQQLLASVKTEDGTQREIIIAKPSDIAVKDLVGLGTIIVVTESNHQIAEAILVEKDEQTGRLIERGMITPKLMAIPTIEKDIKTATKKELQEAVDEDKAKVIETTVPKETPKKPIKVEKQEGDSSLDGSEAVTPTKPIKPEKNTTIIVDGDEWEEFTEQIEEEYMEEVPKYEEVGIVRNQVYYFDKEGNEHVYGWYDEIDTGADYEQFMKEETQDGKAHYRDIEVETRKIQIGVETVPKTRTVAKTAWKNKQTGEIVYEKP